MASDYNRPMTPSEAAARLTDQLVADRLPYALGGGLAFAAWGVPIDDEAIEIYVFTGEDDMVRLLDSLEEAGAAVDRAAARSALARAGRFETAIGDVPVGVSIAYHPVHEEMQHRRVPLAGDGDKQRWFLSVEDLALSRLVAGEVDELDRLFAAHRDELDASYIRDWLRQILGPADPRHDELASLLPVH